MTNCVYLLCLLELGYLGERQGERIGRHVAKTPLYARSHLPYGLLTPGAAQGSESLTRVNIREFYPSVRFINLGSL